MLLHRPGIYQNIIKKHQDKLVQIRVDNAIHQAHEHQKRNGQPKWDNCELIMSLTRTKSFTMNIILSNSNFMLPQL